MNEIIIITYQIPPSQLGKEKPIRQFEMLLYSLFTVRIKSSVSSSHKDYGGYGGSYMIMSH